MDTQNLTFPTAPDEQGCYFANETEYGVGIKTKKNEAGSILKVGTLSDGRPFEMKKLKARASIQASQQAGKQADLVMPAMIAQAVTIDGKQLVMEQILDELYMDDYSLLVVANESLNFPSGEGK